MANAQLLPIVNNLSVENGQCWVYTYAAGTTTSQATYATNAGASGASNPNPCQLNANGYYNTGIWGIGYYKIIIKDPTNTTTLLTLDNISGSEAPVTPTGGGGTTTSTLLNPSANRLDNTDFIYSNTLHNDNITIGVVSNNTIIANAWTLLSQTSSVIGQRITDTSNSLSPSYLRVIQSQSTPQKYGIIQSLHGSNLIPMLGQTVQASINIRASVASNWNIATVIQTNTPVGSPTSNVVNSWTNPILTSGNFFINGSDPAGSAVITAIPGSTWTTISTSLTVPANATNILFFVWSNEAQILNSTADFTAAMLYEGTAAVNYRPVNHSAALGQAFSANNIITKESLLDNPEFSFFQRVGPSASNVSNNTYGPDRWKILTQSNPVSISRGGLTSPAVGSSNYLSIQQTNVTPQLCGIIQFLSNSDTLKLISQQVYLQIQGQMSNSGNINIALLEWTGTADSPTTNVVNNWTSTNYSSGNFFNSTSLETLGYSSTVCPSGTFTICPLPALSVDTSATNLAVMIWSSAAMPQSTYMYLTSSLLCVDDHPELTKVYKGRDQASELLRCRRFYNKSYSVDVVPGTTTSLNAYQVCVGGIPQTGLNANFPTSMNTIPTVTLYSPTTGTSGKTYNISGATDVTCSLTSGTLSTDRIPSFTNNGGAFITGQIYQVHYTADCDF